MDIIYNGEIYLKKGPEIYNPSADIKEIDEKIEELQKECNLQGLITIIYQFYSSITINDPLGNCAIRNLIIADLNGDIINTGLLRDKPTFKNIKEINR